MAELDLCLRGGRAFVAGELVEADLYVQGESVALISSRSETPARRFIDVSGKLLLPGIIDLHAHTRDPGYTHKEDFFSISQLPH